MKSIFEMTPDERKAIMDANPPSIQLHSKMSGSFNWCWDGCGFGQLYFYKTGNKVNISNEGMSKENVRKLMHAFVDKIVDEAEMDS